MTERLRIQNFAGIQEIEIEIKKFNILIGSQASGKSVCAKLLFYFKSFPDRVLSAVENEAGKRDFDADCIGSFLEYFPPDSWGERDFSIAYTTPKVEIKVQRKPGTKGKISLEYSKIFSDQLAYLKKLQQKIAKEEAQIRADEFIQAIKRRIELHRNLVESLKSALGNDLVFKQLFIPAGRSFFAALQSNVFSFLSGKNEIDPFLKLFGATYESIKDWYAREIDMNPALAVHQEVNRLVARSLCGKYIHEKGKDFLDTSDGRRIQIASASSGQQEVLPLVILLKALLNLNSLLGGETLYIEEPEAHLFPDAQRNIVDLMATVFGHRKDRLQLFITTHSPYVLTAVNNLLQAGNLYKHSDASVSKRIEEIVPRYKALNVDDVTAYFLDGGFGRNIVCSETGLIDANAIDAISDELAVQFEQLLNLT